MGLEGAKNFLFLFVLATFFLHFIHLSGLLSQQVGYLNGV